MGIPIRIVLAIMGRFSKIYGDQKSNTVTFDFAIKFHFNQIWSKIRKTIEAFSTTCNVYLSRINLNIAITDMVDRKSSGLNEAICRQEINGTDLSKRNVVSRNTTDYDSEDTSEKFTWTNKQQGLMLGSVIQQTFWNQAYIG